MGISMDSLPPRYQKQAARKLDPAAYEKALRFFHDEEDKSPARQAQGSISHALGESFEAQILTACEYYRSICHAEIDKTPEPIKVISGRHQNPSGCWSFEAVFTKQAQPDFQGTIDGGRSVVFEAKATDKDRILQSAVTHEQAYAMQSHAQKGALVFVLVCLRGRAVYRVPWEVWWRMKEHFGHKYMTSGELEPYRVQMRRGVILFLGDSGEDA